MKLAWFHFVAIAILAHAPASAQQAGNGSSSPLKLENGQSNSGRPLRVRLSQGVSAGLLIKKKRPHYPDKARRDGIEGTVVVQAVIDTSGEVKDVTLVAGHPLLAPAALEAVKRWKYKPYLLNGQPVEFETQVVVAFQLSAH